MSNYKDRLIAPYDHGYDDAAAMDDDEPRCLVLGCNEIATPTPGPYRCDVHADVPDHRVEREPRGAWGERFEYEGDRYDPSDESLPEDQI